MQRLSWLVALVAACLLPVGLQAAEPYITLHTNIRDIQGEDNHFTLYIGGTKGAEFLVDCGFGPILYEIDEQYDPDDATVMGTPVSCQVSEAGIVKVYADAPDVDYVGALGIYMDEVAFADPSKISILDVRHNELKALDLSAFTGLQVALLSDNPYDVSPLKLGPNHPELLYVEINAVPNIDPDFDITTYPKLSILDAFAVPGLTRLDPTKCPLLVRLSLDCTNVSSLDLSNNGELVILNISETAIPSIDLSGCPKLEEFYAVHESPRYNADTKLTSLDLSHNPKLVHLFLSGNRLTSIDLSHNPNLDHVWLQNNCLTSLDLSNNPAVTSLRIEKNYFDWVTMPEDKETYNEYEYAQHPFEVPSVIGAGSSIDLSSRVNRPETTTYALLWSVSESSPAERTEVDADKYTYADGVITFHEALPDSVYVAFANSAFSTSSTELRTGMFKVKSAEEAGKPNLKFSFSTISDPTKLLSFKVGVQGATEAAPKTFYVDFGDGTMRSCSATSTGLPANPNVFGTSSSYPVKVYAEEGDVVTAVGIDGWYLTKADVSAMPGLQELSLTGTELYLLDLQWNRALRSLTLHGNHLSNVNLDGANGYYSKVHLTDIDLSGNEITSFSISDVSAMKRLNLSNNKIEDINFTDAAALETLNISGNLLTELKLGYCESLKTLDASDNKLTFYVAPETNVITSARFDGNCFTYANIPERNGLGESAFIYAPQQPIGIPAEAPGADLSSQALTIDGKPVTFVWKKADGTVLAEGTDYTISQGRTRFLNTGLGKVYCEMSCAAYPAFTGDNVLKTTEMTVCAMPERVVATFHTTEESEVNLSLATVGDGLIFIDWNGDGSAVEQYQTWQEYTLYDAQAHAGKDVKVYCDGEIRVFSISGAKMSEFDGSALSSARNISLYEAGAAKVTLPTVKTALAELALPGSELQSIDLSAYPNLSFLTLSRNKLTKLDLSANKELQGVMVSGNELTEVKFSTDSKIWGLDLSHNKLTGIDLQQFPHLNQCSLIGNELTSINVEGLDELRALYLDKNRFTFATLPLPNSAWGGYYTYADQEDLTPVINADNSVDLSSQAKVGSVETAYTWYLDEPVYDEEGNMQGEELIEGTEYTIEAGVTKFLKSFNGVMCVMTNETFPNLTLFTPLINVASGLAAIDADGIDPSAVYYDLQGNRVESPTAGVYIVVRGTTVTKERL